MIPSASLTITAVMGLSLVLLVVAVVRANGRRSYRLPRRVLSDADGVRASNRRWQRAGVAGLSLVVAVGVGALFAAGVTDSLRNDAWMAVSGMLGAVIVGYLAWGVHHSVRFRGRPNSIAVAVSAWALGLLFIAAVMVKLLLG